MLLWGMAKITLFGKAGTGTSTTGKALAEKLNYSFLSSGNLYRDEAKKMGISIYEMGELAKFDPKFDKLIDERVEEYGKNNDNFVVESWLAWHFIPDSIKIKLDCDFEERVKRVARRDGQEVDIVRELTKNREKTNAERYLTYYNISDFSDDSHFDLVLDTTHTPVFELVEKIKAFVEEKLIHKTQA
jgi:CMP/dCMP kinase